MSTWRSIASLAIQNAQSKDSDQPAQYAQADLNLCWTHMFEGSFSDVAAQNGYRAQISIDVTAIEN